MRGYKYILFILMLLMSVRMQGQYNPVNPAEPGTYYTLTLQVTPTGGGTLSVGTTTRYSEGTLVAVRAYTNSDFTFEAWEQDGEVLSTLSTIFYTMPAKDVTLVARYKYVPGNPAEPSEPNLPEYSTLYLSVSPSGGGSLNTKSGGKYVVGTVVTLTASSNSYYSFVNWTENGEVVATSATFKYAVKAGNPKLVANFVYSPSNPAEPSEARLYRKLVLRSNPSDGGYFNVSSGNEYLEGTKVSLKATANKWYVFKNWTIGDSIISENSSFSYTMPTSNVTLTANFVYDYNPSNPTEPSVSTTDQVGIYGLGENGERGQTIVYPVYLENDVTVSGIVVDIQFPQGFLARTDSVLLTNRVADQKMEVMDLGENNFRFYLLGKENFADNNGRIFAVPVSIPDTAKAGYNHSVVLRHGVMHRTDSTQTAIPVRRGYIYVAKHTSDSLYAKFSYDKLLNRVQFQNISTGNCQRVLWNFGDGETSTEANPLHVFAKSGYYNVTLTVSGEVDTDVAEQTVGISSEYSWCVDGMFYLGDEAGGVRYFTSAESLFNFLGSASVSGNLQVAVKSDGSYGYPLSSDNVAALKSLQASLAKGGYELALSKDGDGRNPVVHFGEQDGVADSAFVALYVELDNNLVCEDVDLRLWGVAFYPAEIKRLGSQTIHSGETTAEVDFTAISGDLTYAWSLADVPTKVTGFVASGEQSIPAMTIVNNSDEACNLVYDVTCLHKDSVFYAFTYTIGIAAGTGIRTASVDSFNIYPNPIQSRLYVDGDNARITGVRILDLNGMEVLTTDHYTEAGIDVSSLLPDVYFVGIQTSSGYQYKKIVKVN